MKKIRAAVVGYGNIGKYAVEALEAAEDFEIAGIVRQNRLVVVNEFSVDTPKTKALLEKLKSLDLQNVFIVDQEVTENLYLASRNLGKSVRVSDVLAMDPVSLIRHDKVLMTSGAVRKVEELWGRIPDSAESGEAIANKVLYEANVFLTPGFIFGSRGERYIRISLCCKNETLEEALKRIENL